MKEEKERVGTGNAHPNKLITHSKFKASSECYPNAMLLKGNVYAWAACRW